ncbi:hypothetical protein VPHD435_0184 [Vibrio phage D435]
MSEENISLPVVNDYHHACIKVGLLKGIIFDLQRTQHENVTEEKRTLFLAKAEESLAKAQAVVNQQRPFEAPDRILDNIEEIEARQEIWREYGIRNVIPEVHKEVFNYTAPTHAEQVRAAGGETGEDLELD